MRPDNTLAQTLRSASWSALIVSAVMLIASMAYGLHTQMQVIYSAGPGFSQRTMSDIENSSPLSMVMSWHFADKMAVATVIMLFVTILTSCLCGGAKQLWLTFVISAVSALYFQPLLLQQLVDAMPWVAIGSLVAIGFVRAIRVVRRTRLVDIPQTSGDIPDLAAHSGPFNVKTGGAAEPYSSSQVIRGGSRGGAPWG